jgi:hypothetical protein
VPKKAKNSRTDDSSLRLISLKSIAKLVDAHRAIVRRWLNDEGIRPVAMGQIRNGAIRDRWCDIER